MRMHPILVLVVGLTLAACDGTGGPSTDGTLVVSTSTGGNDPDPDGYLLTVDGVESVVLAPIGTAEVDVAPGRHTLRLLDVADDCSVVPETSLEVNVPPQSTTPVAFEISCRATGARVTTMTTGLDLDFDGYGVMVDGIGRGAIAANGTILIQLDPGSRTIALTGLSPNCGIEGPGPRSVTIVNNEVASIEFAVVCTARGLPLPTSGVLAFTGPDGDIHLGSASGQIFRDLTSDNLDSFDTDAAWSPVGIGLRSHGEIRRGSTSLTPMGPIWCASPPPGFTTLSRVGLRTGNGSPSCTVVILLLTRFTS